jgi:plasmid stabilization system protein ParE
MNYSVNITDLAEEDILTTVKYISDVLKNPVAANNLLDKIERHEKMLEGTPDIYSFVQDEYLSEKGLRSVRINDYLIYYTIDEGNNAVNVIRFLYEQKNRKNIFVKEEIDNL